MKMPSTPAALEILLSGLFDYAGMFPPAALPLDSALRESAGLYTTLLRPWILGADMVVPSQVARTLLAMNLKPFGFSRPVRLALLASESPQSIDELVVAFLSSSNADGIQLALTSIELKVPFDDSASIVDHFDRLAVRHQIPLFLEPDLSQTDWEKTLAATTTLLSQCKSVAGLKCRLTGPSGIRTDRLSRAIALACGHKFPFKVTGGLHHPFPNPKQHDSKSGFLNVAAAVMLRRSCGDRMNEERICALLENQDANAISFDSSLRFSDLVVEPEQLSAIKISSPFSIGSCNLKEPDEDLHKLLD